MVIALPVRVAIFSLAGSFAAAAADVTPPWPPTCDGWVETGLGGVVKEGVRWEYGYPNFINSTAVPVAVHTCSSPTQRSVRVGPFSTRPGGSYDITSAIVEPLFQVGDRITSMRALPATPAGEPIGYPPLYVHHIHVGRLTGFYDEHWFTTHGDFAIGNDFGIGALSTKGYTTFLPDGHCFAVDCPLPFAVQAIIQDMRADDPSVPDISVYIEVHFTLAPREAALEPATLVWNEAPHGPFGYKRYAVLPEPSMSWWTMRWPESGVLLPRAKFHTHYARHHRLFLIDSAPQDLAFLASHVNGLVRVHESLTPTSAHETMLLSNVSHTEQTLSQLPSVICQDDSTMPSFIEAAAAGHPSGSRWARRRNFVCSSRALEKGRIYTFVQLYRTVAAPEVQLYPMHTNTWFYLQRPGVASSSDIKTVSYRYATVRTKSLLEPIQNEAFGSCEGTPSAAAVAKYVADNNAGLARAVSAHQAGDAAKAQSPAASLVVEAEEKSSRVLTVALPYMAVTSLLAVGLLLARAARGRVQLL